MKTLKATEGKYFASADHKVMGKIIYLPDSVDETQFTEISEATYKKYVKANEEAIKAEIEKLNNQQNEAEEEREVADNQEVEHNDSETEEESESEE